VKSTFTSEIFFSLVHYLIVSVNTNHMAIFHALVFSFINNYVHKNFH